MSDDFGMSAPLSAIPETGHSYTAPPPAAPMPTVLVLTGLGAAVGPASRHKKRLAARCPYEWAWAEGLIVSRHNSCSLVSRLRLRGDIAPHPLLPLVILGDRE